MTDSKSDVRTRKKDGLNTNFKLPLRRMDHFGCCLTKKRGRSLIQLTMLESV